MSQSVAIYHHHCVSKFKYRLVLILIIKQCLYCRPHCTADRDRSETSKAFVGETPNARLVTHESAYSCISFVVSANARTTADSSSRSYQRAERATYRLEPEPYGGRWWCDDSWRHHDEMPPEKKTPWRKPPRLTNNNNKKTGAAQQPVLFLFSFVCWPTRDNSCEGRTAACC